MIRPLCHLLAACALLLAAPSAEAQAATPAATATTAPYTPALWSVSHPKKPGKATIFGTVHSLPRGIDWFKPHVARAVDAADRMVLEVEVPESPAAAVPAINRLAKLSAARPVEERVPAAWRPALEKAKAELKLPILDWYDSWYAALTISNLQAAQDGMDPRIGVEAVLAARAQMRKIPVVGLESIEQQLIYFDALTEADQTRLLVSVLAGRAESKAKVDSLIADWLAGRTDALAASIHEELRDIPMLRRMLVEDRNQRWAAWIDQEMAKPGNLFIAVGAGHVAGANSLLTDLARRGYVVARVAPEPPAPAPKKGRRGR